MKLINAIKEAHAGKYTTLDIKGNYIIKLWDMRKDKGFQTYMRARDKISRHKVLEWFLKKLNII